MTCPILQIFVQQTVGEIGCLTRDGRGLVDPQFHICALADLWEYSLVYCECDMTVIQIPNRDEGCLTSDVSRRGNCKFSVWFCRLFQCGTIYSINTKTYGMWFHIVEPNQTVTTNWFCNVEPNQNVDTDWFHNVEPKQTRSTLWNQTRLLKQIGAAMWNQNTM